MSGLPYLFVLYLITIHPYLYLVPTGGYLCEEHGEEGLSFLGVFQGGRSV